MAGKGNISVNQTAQYGDKTAIQKMGQATTTTAMTGNPAPRPTAGRPAGGGLDQTGQGQPAPLPVPTVHREAMQDLARKAWAAQFWANMAQQPQAGAYIKMYAQAAAQNYRQAVARVQSKTPFFE